MIIRVKKESVNLCNLWEFSLDNILSFHNQFKQ